MSDKYAIIAIICKMGKGADVFILEYIIQVIK